MSDKKTIQLSINGETIVEDVSSDLILSDFLRHELHFTGTKEACGVGVCGLCTVWMDGKTVSSCILPAVCADGAAVYTADGLKKAKKALASSPTHCPDLELWSIVQESFVQCEGMQCGICTPGQVMSALALITETPNPTTEEIKHYMAGNLCRCTGYQSIVRAIESAAERWESRRAEL